MMTPADETHRAPERADRRSTLQACSRRAQGSAAFVVPGALRRPFQRACSLLGPYGARNALAAALLVMIAVPPALVMVAGVPPAVAP